MGLESAQNDNCHLLLKFDLGFRECQAKHWKGGHKNECLPPTNFDASDQ
jgi:hypothetical protein